jgi:Glycosyl hydrolase family 57
VLSDLIGFTYSGWAAEVAASDFVARLADAGRRYREETGGDEALIPIILDGENAWEHFEGGGRPFLRALYRRLSAHPELRTVTMTEATEKATRELPGIFPGSWIDANFYIWIGHADDQKAWRQLADARAALNSATLHADSSALAAAREELLIAEGSDWFWWYGDDHSSAHDLEFDDLFRRHVRNAYRRLQLPVPDELFVTNISTTTALPVQTEPTTLLTPTLDGEETSYFEWLGAGTLEIRDVAGAMHQTDRRPVTVVLVHFGFDHDRLFVRIDTHERVIDLLAVAIEFALTFVTPAAMRLSIRQDAGRLTAALWVRPPGELRWVRRDESDATVAAGTILELALPFADLGVQPGDALAFFVAVHNEHGVEVERHPAHRPIALTAPDALFGARNWRA